MNFSFGNLLAILFKVLANKDRILDLWNKVVAIIPQIRKEIDEILPGILGGGDPAAAGGGTASGFSVEWLQESLNKLDNAGLTVDGDYGALTKAAVKAFQERNGLTADGWAGAATSAKIYDLLTKVP